MLDLYNGKQLAGLSLVELKQQGVKAIPYNDKLYDAAAAADKVANAVRAVLGKDEERLREILSGKQPEKIQLEEFQVLIDSVDAQRGNQRSEQQNDEDEEYEKGEFMS